MRWSLRLQQSSVTLRLTPGAESRTRTPAAAWASLGLALVGLLLSAYLTYEHFTDSATLACTGNGAIDCLKVTTSQWSEIAGVPVAVAGLAYFTQAA